MTVGKYSASGNDFVIYHAFVNVDRSETAVRLCHRQEGVGADGLIVLLPHPEYDFQWQFYNADGSEAAMCGNGSRAAALYAHTHGLAGARMRFLTGAGVIEATVEDNIVTSELTPPVIIDKEIEAFGKRWWLIDTGVPHLTALTESVEHFDIGQARELRHRYNANVNIAAVDNGVLRVRTYERGVEDETLACGTGMAASFLRARLEGKVPERITVVPTGGERLELAVKGETLTLKGAVRHTFDAEIDRLTNGVTF
ncbi:diaminopimelate epimerase [Hydrogenimonas sp. SS33]|uniref:diaminopimelate epimerase n=1 Tax=Hydrogenimonas leucolamina TaxID=2954236 RepID=UPI00336C0455